MLTVSAYAKVNLSLEVVGRRADGFHELVSVMQTVGLADTIRLERAMAPRVTSNSRSLSGPTNLVERAMLLAAARWPQSGRTSIELAKSIPIAAGLGGGSADAAATLVALARLWELDAPCENLASLALQLGSDTPFFLYGGTALVEGRGETVTVLNGSPRRWYLLVNPGVLVSTAAVFAELRPAEWTDGATTRDLARSMSTSESALVGVNGLQAALFRIAPAVHDCYDLVTRLAPGRTFVTGSGATVVAAFKSRQHAERVRTLLARTGYWSAVAPTVTPEPEEVPCRRG